MITQEAKSHNKQLEVRANLENDPHHYDTLLSSFMACKKCYGSGEIFATEDIGEWETEGGAISTNLCECKGEKTKITIDMVKRFFGITIASHNFTVGICRSGAVGFDITINVEENPALQDAVMLQLDTLLFDGGNIEWLINIFPWSVNYQVGVSYRHFSGSVKEAQNITEKWVKNLRQKYGKNITVKNAMLP
jgi:hypothetical protein